VLFREWGPQRLVQDPNSHNSLVWGPYLMSKTTTILWWMWSISEDRGNHTCKVLSFVEAEISMRVVRHPPHAQTNSFASSSSTLLYHQNVGKAVFEGHLTFMNIPLRKRGETLCLDPRNKRKKFHIPFVDLS